MEIKKITKEQWQWFVVILIALMVFGACGGLSYIACDFNGLMSCIG